MAGHSKFKNIQHRKNAQDQKRAKLFTRLVREIITAAKEGNSDPEFNPRLRMAISNAKTMNLPKERVDRALQSAANPQLNDNYDEMRYEGYISDGVAVIVEALTDNKNRTAGEVRKIFSKHGGKLGETGSVSFMFDYVGIIKYQNIDKTENEILEKALEFGAKDVEFNLDNVTIYTEKEDYSEVFEQIVRSLGSPEEAGIGWKPQTTIQISNEDSIDKINSLIDALDENDDVQQVFTNLNVS